MPLKREKPPPKPFSTGNTTDDARLEALAEQAALSVPRHWSHFLVFREEAQARDAAGILGDDWKTNVLPSPEGPGWTLQALKDDVQVSADAVVDARAAMTVVAVAHAGQYEGWMAWV